MVINATKKRDIKAIAFDLGRVIFDFDYNLGLDRIVDKIEVSKECIINALFYEDFATDFEKGIISPQQFYRKFINEFRAKLSYEEFISVWCEIFTPQEGIVSLLHNLNLLYPLYLISNINILHFEHLKHKFPEIFALFEGLVLSYEVKAVKPELEIYNRLAQFAQQDFKNILYIDDRSDLVEKAITYGLNCVLFRDKDSLCESLKGYGVFIIDNGDFATLKELKARLENSPSALVEIVNDVEKERFSPGKLELVNLDRYSESDFINTDKVKIDEYTVFIFVIHNSLEDNGKLFKLHRNYVKVPLLTKLIENLPKKDNLDILVLELNCYKKGYLEANKVWEYFLRRNFSFNHKQ